MIIIKEAYLRDILVLKFSHWTGWFATLFIQLRSKGGICPQTLLPLDVIIRVKGAKELLKRNSPHSHLAPEAGD